MILHNKLHVECSKSNLFSNQSQRKSLSALQLSSDPNFNDWNVKAILASTAGQSVLIALAIAIGKYMESSPLKDANFSNDCILKGFVASIPLFALNFFVKLVFGKEAWFLEIEQSTQDTCKFLFGVQENYVKVAIGALMLSLAAGFGEEMLFRGVIQNAVTNIAGDFTGLSVASVIFGVLHFISPAYAILATISGFYFGAVFTSSGNIAIPIIAHAFYDLVALI
eukprot:CAMPEP_0117756306 /NCGR_PEP_ID=MMETSP0947-20121206/13994_1 /TAXON_ID=44440 /ORGANISM="Chattonella subsalsa, Strain CCMP2191" /LENGTH=223 /DNA_ID=CAMNT_0005575857 /DNA_START=160 /DNA_END=828 /DNA_ORIENTATION=-